jgi:FkbM family methyltransferase
MGIIGFAAGGLRKGIIYGRVGRLRHISNFLGQKYHIIDIPGAGPVRVRPKSSDISSFRQVFEWRCYDLSYFRQFLRVRAAYQRILDGGRIPLIIDAGANVGAASVWFVKLFPEAHIIAVEPDADNAELCRLNTRAWRNIKVIEAAIGSEPGAVSLSNPEKHAWSIRTTRSADGEVPVCTIPQIILDEQTAGSLFLVKVDIEGFENDLFASNIEWLDDAEVVIIEPHDYMFAGEGRCRNFLRELGSRSFEILISGNNLIYIRLPHDFDLANSGLNQSPGAARDHIADYKHARS